MGSNLYQALLECVNEAESRPWQRQRIVLSPAMLTQLTTQENERRASQASEHYRPPPPIDPDTLDPTEVRIFGLPIRLDDAATAPAVEIVDES